MGIKVGDRALAGGIEVRVESIYESDGVEYACVLRPDGGRTIWELSEVKPRPVDEEAERRKKIRRKLVDRILEYKGLPRDNLFEYPHRADDSRRYIANAERLLDDLTAMMKEGETNGD